MSWVRKTKKYNRSKNKMNNRISR